MRILLLVSVMIPLILGSDQQSQQCSYQDQQSGQCQTPAKNEALGRAISKFGIKLYKQITALGHRSCLRNVLFAPISIFQIYTLLLQGAGSGSATYKQILKILELNEFQNDKEINEAMRHLIQDLNSKDRVSEIRTGNAMFLGERIRLSRDFYELMNKYYKVDFNRILFILREHVVKKINEYVKKNTNNKIPHFVGHLRQNTRMVLVDYFYFNGKWKNPFDMKETVDREFTLIDGISIKVPTMQTSGIYRTFWDSDLRCKVIELPYMGCVSLIIAMPNKNIDIFGCSLTIEVFDKWQKYMASSLVTVYLPKFSVNKELDIKDKLQELGVVDVFTKNANLRRMTRVTQFSVSDSWHQAVLDVTEAGTKASASADITAAEVKSPTPEYTINKPFLLIVYDSKTKSIISMGRITDPR